MSRATTIADYSTDADTLSYHTSDYETESDSSSSSSSSSSSASSFSTTSSSEERKNLLQRRRSIIEMLEDKKAEIFRGGKQLTPKQNLAMRRAIMIARQRGFKDYSEGMRKIVQEAIAKA